MLKKLILWLAKRAENRGRVYYVTGRDKEDNDVYMVRYILARNRFFRVYIHKFLRSDDDVYHDHPWHFVTYIANGEYIEKLLNQDGPDWVKTERTIKAGKLIFRHAEHKHIITLKKEYKESDSDAPLTLSIIFWKFREWGFWPENEYGKHSFIPWRRFLGLPEDFVHLEKKDLMEA